MLQPKKVAAIHDLSGFGRASLTVVMPVLSSMGIQVCPLPTAVFSTHGGYKNNSFLDLTDNMTAMMSHWKALNLEFDGIYSGFLGSSKQISIVKEFISHFKKNTLVVVDPVMGDNGRVYGVLDKKLPGEMADLVKKADVITPNITEAQVLLNRPYNPALSEEELKETLIRLSDMGPDTVVITSLEESSGERGSYSAVWQRSTETFFTARCDHFPVNYPGTGDTFTSVFTGSLLNNLSVPEALKSSVDFIGKALKATWSKEHDPRSGIHLESVL